MGMGKWGKWGQELIHNLQTPKKIRIGAMDYSEDIYSISLFIYFFDDKLCVRKLQNSHWFSKKKLI